MSDGVKLIGYSSDEEMIFGSYNQKLSELFAPFIKKKTTPKGGNKNKDSFKKYIQELNTTCCYCECIMDFHNGFKPNSATKDHIIPKHKGGKITKPCCFECNQEKGGLMLDSYIQMLEYNNQYLVGDPLIKNQIKIRNAKIIEFKISKIT